MTESSSPALKAYLAVAGGVLSLALSPILVRWANAPAPVTGFYRMSVALAVLALPFYRRMSDEGYLHSDGLRRLPRQEVKIALLGGLFFGGDIAFWMTGVMLSL